MLYVVALTGMTSLYNGSPRVRGRGFSYGHSGPPAPGAVIISGPASGS